MFQQSRVSGWYVQATQPGSFDAQLEQHALWLVRLTWCAVAAFIMPRLMMVKLDGQVEERNGGGGGEPVELWIRRRSASIADDASLQASPRKLRRRA